MTIEIPIWLLYTLYAIGGLIGLVVVLGVAFFAFIGVAFVTKWRPPQW